MEHLFTPWRMDYISSVRKPGCIFCEMLEAGDDRASLIVRRSERAFLVLNRYPYTNGHLMAVPYRHAAGLDDLDPEETADVMALLSDALRALRSLFHPDGFNIGANMGRVAGAGVEGHVHMHVVPRWNGDTNFMPVFADTRVIPQALDETYGLLAGALGS
jgi:ATP adenylyltransferase